MVKQPSLSIKLFSCTNCSYKSKAMVPLKNHILKNYRSARKKCELCGFESTDNDVENNMKELHMVHMTILAQIRIKRKKSVIGCDQCGVTLDTKPKLKRHKESQHNVCEESFSSSEQSPPKKKALQVVKVKNVQEQEEEMIDNMERDTKDTQNLLDTTKKMIL